MNKIKAYKNAVWYKWSADIAGIKKTILIDFLGQEFGQDAFDKQCLEKDPLKKISYFLDNKTRFNAKEFIVLINLAWFLIDDSTKRLIIKYFWTIYSWTRKNITTRFNIIYDASKGKVALLNKIKDCFLIKNKIWKVYLKSWKIIISEVSEVW